MSEVRIRRLETNLAHLRAELIAAERRRSEVAHRAARARERFSQAKRLLMQMNAMRERAEQEAAEAAQEGHLVPELRARARTHHREFEKAAQELGVAEAKSAHATMELEDADRQAESAAEALAAMERHILRQEPVLTALNGPPELPFAAPEDVPGYDTLKPDPLKAETAAEFVELMKQYRIWAKEPSYREIVRRARNAFGASTLCQALKSTHLPSAKLVEAFIWACSGSQEDLQAWMTAWRRLRMKHQRPSSETLAPVTRLPVGQSSELTG
ncbi:hypothetical protein AB0C27_54030 [Nonomuraea sp. NPDC048882]|uniref:hypothetical protein n=1 Tax=Nonomuraea sp. NPDC048882 TaxID=3154347 RepID=UPI0033C943D6